LRDFTRFYFGNLKPATFRLTFLDLEGLWDAGVEQGPGPSAPLIPPE